MKNDIRLFINDQEIEFSADPKILLNYKETELHNPTIVRNAFTKQIQVEGTPRNNDIFGHIWELTRIQDESNFNPIIKTDFQLFVNDQLFSKGYVKLDKVTRTNNTTTYSLTLYGNLGSFFYNLSYLENSNVKKTLADLSYHDAWSTEPDMSFDITKENVYEAWGMIAGFGQTSNPRWHIINFVPAYNGIPNDFDAAKVLINNYHLNSTMYYDSGFQNGITVDGKTYRPVLNGVMNQYGYSLGEMPHDMTEWETRDLRSYLQRPCLSMKALIDACCQPDNNGGFQVKLDSHFFHYNNPYYTDAWVTLPLLKDLEGTGGGEDITITGATIPTASTTQYGANLYTVNMGGQSLASIKNVNMNVSVRFNPGSSTSANEVHAHRKYTSNTSFTLNGSTYVKTMERNTGIVLQMFALSTNGEVVAQSKAYFLGESDTRPKKGGKMWDDFYNKDNDLGAEPEYVYLQGYWKKVSGNYVFVNKYGQQTDINFSLTSPANFATLVIKAKTPYGEYIKYAFSGWESSWQGNNTSSLPLYTSEYYNTSGNKTKSQVAVIDEVLGRFSFVVTSMYAQGTDYEALFSGTRITKDKLMTTQYSPADYLLSYCKMFGLYFYYDSAEASDDPELYPNGVVHIMDRDTFYTDEVVDLSKMIDWEKKVEITPALAAAKWYEMDVEHHESEVGNVYKQQYGREYGSQTIDTNYNFDNNTIELYDGNVFKAGVMVLEKDKYFKKTRGGLPVYQFNGLTYNLFYAAQGSDEYETQEISYPQTTSMYLSAINADYEYFDSFPKLQFHTEENSPSDGDNVLVFLKGGIEVGADYWLTDDVNDMVILNDSTPCWILTRDEYNQAGERIAYKLNYLPLFTRDLILFGSQYGNIVHSWNFGHPQEVYSPDTFTTEGDSIYDVCWKDYIHDLYSVDTRKLSCYVRAELDEKPWPYWLRRFYWFENSIWALNEIKDMNPTSFDTTKMEFIKVQDMDNYKLEQIQYQGHNQLVLDSSTLACTGGNMTGKMILQSAGGWFAGDVIPGVDGDGHNYYLETAQVMTPHTGRGQTVSTFRIAVPANTGDTPITWTLGVEDDFDVWYHASFVQETCNTGSTLTLSPTAITVGARAGSTALTMTAVRVTDITVTSSAEWATITQNGNTITVSYPKNTTTTARTATITVAGTGVEGDMTATATITQNGLGQITTNTNEVVLDWNQTTGATFTITTDDDWTTTIIDNTI